MTAWIREDRSRHHDIAYISLSCLKSSIRKLNYPSLAALAKHDPYLSKFLHQPGKT